VYAASAKCGRSRSARCLATSLVLAVTAGTLAQTALDRATVSELRSPCFEKMPVAKDTTPVRQTLKYCGHAPLPDDVIIVDEPGNDPRGAVDLYTGLQPSGNGFWFWTIGGSEAVYWALDDGLMGPGAAAVGGGHVTELEFSFGLHADGANDTLRPYVIVSFYNAPPDPIADATDPVVEPPTPVMSIAFNFDPITLPAAGFYAFRSGLVDLTAAGLDFGLDETFYVEILPLEWSSYPNGSPILDPDVFAMFTGPGTVTCGTNQDHLWSDLWVLQGGCDPTAHLVNGDGDGYYDHPAELDDGGCSPHLNQSGIILRGLECTEVNTLALSINEPDNICVRPGEPVMVTLSQACLPGLVRGYQAFLTFDPAALTFDSGSYITPLPYGLPIITPITAVGGDIDLAAGIDDSIGQLPTSLSADLVTLDFTAGSAEGPTQVVFRAHDPPTRFSDEYGNEVVPTLVNSPTICVDGTPPTIMCPPDLDLQCVPEVPAPATDLAEFVAQGGSASDSSPCGSVTLTHEGDVVTSGSGCPGDPYIVERTYRATDCADNFAECLQTITVVDDTPPTITGCPAGLTVSNDPGLCSAVVCWTAPTASDNCGTVNLVSTHDPGDTFPVGTTTVTYTATDACGNATDCVFDVTVNDDENPTITCPADITINADAGDCTAYVTVPAPVTGDNCGVASVLNDYNGTADASDTYPSGTTIVNWTVTDIYGNPNTCSHTVTVTGVNELVVDVQLSPTIVPCPITRCITFELWECPDTAPAETVRQTITFVNGEATGVLVPVPCGNYTCLTARDELHTLRRTDEDQFGVCPIVGTQYVADFTDQSGSGGDNDALIGGDLNDDLRIDILDFGVFSSEWGADYGTGDTDCSTLPPHADINGDGWVTTADFTFIQIHFLEQADDNCCGQPGLGDGDDGPITAISVVDLEAMGLSELAAGDLNNDGWLDVADIVAFLNGARPRPQPAPAERMNSVPRPTTPREPRP